MLANIPEELKSIPQWIVWKYETAANREKPTKVPYCPFDGMPASPTNPATWCGFEQAVFAYQNNGIYNGVGFVLTENDPYSFIDLDATTDPDQFALQQQIFQSFDTYAELSPSGQGLHIICKGFVPTGKRRKSVEIYSTDRYMTMTGNVYRQASINDCHETLRSLWAYIGGDDEQKAKGTIDAAQVGSDSDVIEKARNAANAAKFVDLFEGRWQGIYSSQSEADYALIDIIAYYTDNKEQVARIFRSSALGQREKAQRKDYVNKMVNKSFDRKLPPIDHDQLSERLYYAIEEKKRRGRPKEKFAKEYSNPYTMPPGLVGRMASFFYAAAPRPVPEIALTSAIGLLAGMAGRAYNISGTGLNLYVVLLARTGTGKEALGEGISTLIKEVKRFAPTASEFIGPSVIASPQALIKKLAKQKSFVSIIGEIGLKLQEMTWKGASPNDRGILRVMLDLYNKSGKGSMLGAMAYSDSEKDVTAIDSPAFSMIGESTPEGFFQAIDENSIRSGLVPRFTVIDYKGERPDLSENRASIHDNLQLVDDVAKLAAQCAMLNHQNQNVSVALDESAHRIFYHYNRYVDSQIRGKEDVSREIWNRAHIKALKLAALIAVGCNMFNPVVTEDIANWAINIENYNVEMLLERFTAGEVGASQETSESKQYKELKRVIRDWLLAPWDKLEKYNAGTVEMFAAKVVPYKYVQMRLVNLAAFREDRRGATNAIKNAIQTMCDHGDLQITSNAAMFKTNAKVLSVTNASAFL